MHEVVCVLVDKEIDVEKTMAPYDENNDETDHMTDNELREWSKEFFSEEEIEKMTIHELSTKLDEEGYVRGLEKNSISNLWSVTVQTGNGYWDWYEVGGRWDNKFAKGNVMPAEDYIELYLEQSKDPAKLLTHKLSDIPPYIPSQYVTKEQWCEFGTETQADKDEITDFIRSSGKKLIVFVDKHC